MQLPQLKTAFLQTFGQPADAIYFAPGRVNLIGEHTDYNGGFVFPCALSFGTYLLLAPNKDDVFRFRSLNVPERIDVPLHKLTDVLPNHCWANYPLGCIAQSVRRGWAPTTGYDLLFSGDVPQGAGLSSSAAIEVVTAFAFSELSHTNLSSTEIALIGQASEHEFAGVNCGIMDQFASAHGKKDHAIFLNCDTMEFQLVPIALRGIKIVIANTHSPHKLDSGAYNARVSECQTALSQLRKVRPDLKNLAELTPSDFEACSVAITDAVAFRRARHVVGEVDRTRRAVEALQAGDITLFGKLMNQSHVSLRDDYEVTGPELDAMAEAAWQVNGVIGSRMTGGGFGGCTVSLVQEEAIPAFIDSVGKTYTARTGLKADFYIAEIGDRVHRL